MSRQRDYDPEEEPEGPISIDPLAGYAPAGTRGPATTLTEEMIPLIARNIAKGCTKADAAALAGTTAYCLDAWLKRGRASVESKKRSRYTRLLVEVERAAAHYRSVLVGLGNDSIGDKKMNDKFIRWRLGVSDPKNFTIPREAPAAAANGLGPLFEMVTPEEAKAKLEAKLERFLADEAKAQADAAEPPPSAGPEPADGA